MFRLFQQCFSTFGAACHSCIATQQLYQKSLGDFSRFAGFATSLTGTGCKTQGVVLTNKVRMLDLNARQAKKIEVAPKEVIHDAMARLNALFE